MNKRNPFGGRSSRLMLELLAQRDYSGTELVVALESVHCCITHSVVRRRLNEMHAAGWVTFEIRPGKAHVRAYRYIKPEVRPEPVDVDEPLEREPAQPIGIIPTRKLDPIAWIVATSGVELEAA